MKTQKINYQKEIIQILERLMKEVKEEWGDRNLFADTQILTDKVMTYTHNRDESKGWTGTMSSITEKPKDSDVVVLVTYDGAGYDFFSVSGNGYLTDKLEEELIEKFGDRFDIQHCNNWAFEICDCKK